MGLAGRKYLEENFSRTVLAEKIMDILNSLSH
jgi:hypothetical protein